eukprot:RCo035891
MRGPSHPDSDGNGHPDGAAPPHNLSPLLPNGNGLQRWLWEACTKNATRVLVEPVPIPQPPHVLLRDETSSRVDGDGWQTGCRPAGGRCNKGEAPLACCSGVPLPQPG